MDKIIVTVGGIILSAFIYWFFFGKKDESEKQEIATDIKVVVEGGYKPQVIRVPKGKKVTLTFLRKDSNSCLEEVVFPDYKIKKYLPLGEEVKITLNPPHKSESQFHCGMSMFFGKIKAI